MGVRAHLQVGRTKHGLVLPAKAQAALAAVQDKSTLDRWLYGKDAPEHAGELPGPGLVRSPAAPSKATLTSSPVPPDVEAQQAEAAGGKKAAKGQAAAATGPDDLTEIGGVGEALAKKLKAAGYDSYEKLSGADTEALAEAVDGISEDGAKDIIKQAKKLEKKKSSLISRMMGK